MSAEELEGIDGIYLVNEIDDFSDGDIIEEEDEEDEDEFEDKTHGDSDKIEDNQCVKSTNDGPTDTQAKENCCSVSCTSSNYKP